jgi:uncharacterized protein YegP (UPF0339 family)
VNATIQTYRDRTGEYRWRMRAKNGRIIADGAEGYKTKRGARRAAERLLDIVRNSTVDIRELDA